MQALERGEELVYVSHVEPRTVVPHEVGRAGFLLHYADLDSRLRCLRGELPRIAQQVLEEHPHEPAVGVDGQPFRYDDVDRTLGLPSAQLFGDRTGDFG